MHRLYGRWNRKRGDTQVTIESATNLFGRFNNGISCRARPSDLLMLGPDPPPSGNPEGDIEDVRLMELVGKGDTFAFEQLIERHQTLVTGTIARMLGSNSDVEDIA